MNKVKIGVIGCGNMAQLAHIPCLASVENAEITALCDFRKPVTEQLCQKWNVPNSIGSIEELLKLDLDAVYVLTPVQSHLQNIKAILESGISVFTEKPAAMCADSARELQKYSAASGKNVTVGYMKRHDANIAALKKLQSENDWGKLLFVRTHSFIGSHWDAAITDLVTTSKSDDIPPFDASILDPGPTWLNAPRDSTFYSFDNPFYGLLDTGCHSINLLRHLTDTAPEATGVKNAGGVKLVDFNLNGTPGVMEFCVNFAMHHWDEVTELYYEKASVTIKTPPPLDMQTSAIVEIYSEDGNLHNNLVLEDNRQWEFRLQAEAFVNSVRNNTVANDLETAEQDIAVIEDIYKLEQDAK